MLSLFCFYLIQSLTPLSFFLLIYPYSFFEIAIFCPALFFGSIGSADYVFFPVSVLVVFFVLLSFLRRN